MIHLNLNVIYDISNKTKEHSQRQNHYRPLIFPYQFNFFQFLDWKSSSVTSSVLLWILIFMIPLFKHITRPSSMPLQEIKLTPIVNWSLR